MPKSGRIGLKVGVREDWLDAGGASGGKKKEAGKVTRGNHQVVSMNYSHFALAPEPSQNLVKDAILEWHCQELDAG